MPCFCGDDLPPISDQRMIHDRQRYKMFLDAEKLLSLKQKREYEATLPNMIEEDVITYKLCKMCKVMTKWQMESVSARYSDACNMYQIDWPHQTLYDWHLQHCKDDIAHNKQKQDLRQELRDAINNFFDSCKGRFHNELINDEIKYLESCKVLKQE